MRYRCCNEKYSHIFWDWNGTLVDDAGYAVGVMNAMLSKRNLPLVGGVEEYRRVFMFPVIEYYEKLGYDFNVESFENLTKEFSQNYLSGCSQLKLHTDAATVLKAAHKKGTKQIILSATQQQSLIVQVRNHNIEKYLDGILGLPHFKASSKIETAKEYIRENKIDKALMIGDTIHDAEVAVAIGADCILFSGGHADIDCLKTAGCMVINKLSGVLQCI